MHNSSIDLVGYSAQQLVFRERFSQILLGSNNAATSAIKQSVLAGQHDDGRLLEYFVVLDKRAGLITIQSRHHDIDENQIRLVVSDFRQCIETVNGGKNLAALLRQ